MPRNELLIAARIERNLTQRELAALVGVAERTLRGWEYGATRPQPEPMRRLLHHLGAASPTVLGFAFSPRRGPRGTVALGGNSRKGTRDVLSRRDLLGIVTSAMGGALALPVARLFPAPTGPVRIGAGDVAEVNLLRVYSNDLERMMGGGALNPTALIRQFRITLGKLHGVYRDTAVRQEMHEAVAHYGTTVGWILVDQNEHAVAQRVFGAALAATAGAGAERQGAIRALVLTDMSRQAIYLEDHPTALCLLDVMDPSLDRLPDDVRAIVLARRARALGGLGDVHAVTALTRQAEDEFGCSPQASAAAYEDIGFSREELASDIGHAYSALAVSHGLRGEEAERRLAASIAAYGPADTRSHALAGIRLTNVHLARGDGRRALDVAREHVAGARLVQSTAVQEAAGSAVALAARRKHEPGMADVIDLFQDLRRTT